MIPNITRGSRMSGLMVYLASTDADKTKNVHSDPHLVAGDAAIMAWYDNGTIGRDDALAIAKHLDEPHKKFGVEVPRKDLRWDPVLKRKVEHGQKHADVWHCSMSLRAGERELTDQEWGDIANEFVDRMGFTEASGKAQCRWAAINHGVSAGGNHHIHIAVSLVREDGTKASTHGDYRRSQEVCRDLERTHGLEQLSTLRATRGFDRAEPQTAVRNEREMYRASLSRKVRAAATSATTEAEFIRAGRKSGLLMRPRYEKGTTDVVVGYSVAERPVDGERPIWYGGGKLASDLGLGQLREQRTDTPEGATEAAAEWNAAARNRKTTTAEKQATPTPELWEKYIAQAKEYADRLHSIPVTDHATWAKAARDASGVFAAWSLHAEATPGPLAATADELSKTAQLRDRQQHSKPVSLPSLAGATMLVLAAGSESTTAAYAALMVQLIRTSKALYEMHVESRNLRESQNLNRVLMNELRPVYTNLIADLPKTGQRVPQSSDRAPVRSGEALTPAQIAARGTVPWRQGSVVPKKLSPDPRKAPPAVARPAALQASERIRDEVKNRYGIDTNDLQGDRAYLQDAVGTQQGATARAEELRKHNEAMALIATAQAAELQREAQGLRGEIERLEVPEQYLADPVLLEALRGARDASDVDARTDAERAVAERVHLIKEDGLQGPTIEQLREEIGGSYSGANDSLFQDPAFVAAAKDWHEARVLAEGGFVSQDKGLEARYEASEKELFSRIGALGRDIENDVLNEHRATPASQHQEGCAAYGSGEHRKAFASTLEGTGSPEEVKGRLVAAADQGRHPREATRQNVKVPAAPRRSPTSSPVREATKGGPTR